MSVENSTMYSLYPFKVGFIRVFDEGHCNYIPISRFNEITKDFLNRNKYENWVANVPLIINDLD